ncbi:MAG: glycosyltransferase family 4 protein [Oleiphilaceae bacterium]|nr:glycosyltransferase family 4 protein [Oleiphilaceae bacterium]
MTGFFSRKPAKPQFGLVNCLNNRGLGTETRLLKDFFRTHLPEVDFHIYRIPSGRKVKEFDTTWQHNRGFRRWLSGKDMVMTIEHFMPNLFRACRDLGIRTIWRPNFEWIPPHLEREDFQLVDTIMSPQQACADFLESRFGLTNVVRNPWITTLPIQSKAPGQGSVSHFLFNAGRGGVGQRRNHGVVIEAFSQVLSERDDVHFTLKTQTELDVSALAKYRGGRFTYIHKNTSYRKNIDFFRKADFSLAPSKWEGVGFALLESLYCGTPVLTTDAPPMNEWVDHKKSGYLVPASYPDIALPIAFDRTNENGVNWVRAALCDAGDIAAGVHWLADNRESFYQTFNRVNGPVLAQRERDFIDRFREVIHGTA